VCTGGPLATPSNSKSPVHHPQATLARRKEFSAAHFYSQPAFSEAENRAHFGACYTPFGHGLNYLLEVFIAGPIDPQSRWVMNLSELDEILAQVVKPLDHKHLNFDVPAFHKQIPTTENIAVYLWQKLHSLIEKTKGVRIERLRLFETADLWVEVRK